MDQTNEGNANIRHANSLNRLTLNAKTGREAVGSKIVAGHACVVAGVCRLQRVEVNGRQLV